MAANVWRDHGWYVVLLGPGYQRTVGLWRYGVHDGDSQREALERLSDYMRERHTDDAASVTPIDAARQARSEST